MQAKAIPETKEQKPNMRLMNRNFFLLWQGQTVSQLGNQAFQIALALWVKSATGSATLMGLMLMVSTLPAVLLGPIGGVVADRYPRRRILILSDLCGGIAVLMIAGTMFAMPEATTLIVVILFIVSITLAILTSFFTPAISAAIPDIVPEERLPIANGLLQFSYQLAIFVGQGIGGTLFRILGAPMLFLIDGLTFFFSSVSESFIAIPQQIPDKSKHWRSEAQQFKADTIVGFRYVVRTPGLRELVLASAVLSFFMAPVLLLLPFYVEDFLKVTADWYGFLLAAYGLGSMLGFLLAGVAGASGRRRSLLMLLFIVLEPAGYILMGLILRPGIALLSAAVGGLFSGFVLVNVTSLLQLTTPGAVRGRVFGLLATLSGALAPVAMGLSGVVADLTGQNIPVIYIGCGAIAMIFAGTIAVRPAFRVYLAYEGEPGEPHDMA